MSEINEDIIGVFVSKPRPTGPKAVMSAIHKNQVAKLIVHKETLDGDDSYDKRFHGGPYRVIHHYTQKNYERLKLKFPEIADKFKGGSYGENLLTENLDESDFCIGDIFQAGTSTLELTIPRSPCGTINMGYEHNKVLKEIISTGHFGWFYRIIKEGEIKVGDKLKLIERPNPVANLHKLIKSAYKIKKSEISNIDKNFLVKTKCIDSLDNEWVEKIDKTLKLFES